MAKRKNYILLIILILCLCAMLVACGEKTGENTNGGGTSSGRPAYLAYSENGREVMGLVDLNVTNIVIPDGITTIRWDAFSGCKKIKNVTIPDSVTNIGWNAFDGTAWLDDQPNGMVYAGKVAYKYKGVNPQETAIVVKDGTKGVAGRAFEGCNWIKSITIPDSVVEIGNDAFTGCAALEDLTLPFVGKAEKLSDGIAYHPFGYVFGSTKYDKSVAVTQHYFGATSNENRQPEYFLPETLKSVTFSRAELPRYVFENCSMIAQITIPEGVTSIDDGVFYGCSELTNITIPDSVTEIRRDAFSGCYRLLEVFNKSDLEISLGSTDDGYVGYYARNIYTPSSGNRKLSVDDKYVFYTDGTDKELIRYRGSDANLTLPSDTTKIFRNAFANCRSLTSVVIPDSVTAIGDGAFINCSALTSMTIPFVGASKNGTSNTNFGYLFGAYGSYQSSNIPDGLRTVVITGGTSIAAESFYGCSSLTSITIPNSVKNIGKHAFSSCTGLLQMENGVTYVDKWIVDCDEEALSVVLRSDTVGIASNAFYNCKYLTNIDIPESVTSIGDNAFSYCKTLKSVILPDSVTSIGDEAFYYCETLKSVILPDSLTFIGDEAFYYCETLKSVILPDSLTFIGDEAFYYCKSLSSITIPANVNKLGKNVFYGSQISYITFADTTGWYITKGVNSWNEFRNGTLTDVTSSISNANQFTDYSGGYFECYLYKA